MWPSSRDLLRVAYRRQISVLFWIVIFWQQIIFSLVCGNPFSLILTHLLVQSVSQNQSQNGWGWRDQLWGSSSLLPAGSARGGCPALCPVLSISTGGTSTASLGNLFQTNSSPHLTLNTKHMKNSYRPMADPFTTTLANPLIMTVQFWITILYTVGVLSPTKLGMPTL